MTFFCFRHPQENAFAFLVALPLRQMTIRLCRLDLRLPIAFRDFDRVLTTFLLGGHAELKRNKAQLPTCPPNWERRIWVQSAGSSAALMAGSTRARSC